VFTRDLHGKHRTARNDKVICKRTTTTTRRRRPVADYRFLLQCDRSRRRDLYITVHGTADRGNYDVLQTGYARTGFTTFLFFPQCFHRITGKVVARKQFRSYVVFCVYSIADRRTGGCRLRTSNNTSYDNTR